MAIAAEEELDTAALQACMERKSTVALINANRSRHHCATSAPLHVRYWPDPKQRQS